MVSGNKMFSIYLEDFQWNTAEKNLENIVYWILNSMDFFFLEKRE